MKDVQNRIYIVADTRVTANGATVMNFNLFENDDDSSIKTTQNFMTVLNWVSQYIYRPTTESVGVLGYTITSSEQLVQLISEYDRDPVNFLPKIV